MILICASFLPATFADQAETKEVKIAINGVFIPDVVAKESDAKIVVSGMYPNSCYRWSRSQVDSPKELYHEVNSLALVTINMMCLQVLVPFNHEINLGRLPAGTHTLRFTSGDGTYFERSMEVQ